MHLLNARTYQLETFLDDKKRPKYAILSHTWGAEEVTFQEIANLEQAKLKAGFLKIQYTCKQAILDGYTYAWVDTCCIDKSSSAELSEAINSMFKWYQKSEICYAYLSDVRSNGKGLVTPFDMNVEDSMEFKRANGTDNAAVTNSPRWSRWFTRGWTLQELLAPARLHFYDRSWTSLGPLSELTANVSRVTNIPKLLLSRKIDLHNYSIARRMSWASHRVTTRTEDHAYALLGIFGVNMPLLYGEGNKAFLRLQEEIIKTTTDDSFLAWACDESNINQRYTDVLAVSPLQFAHCGHIVAAIGASHSWTMTNQGLKIGLQLTHVPQGNMYDGYLANLSCYDERDITAALHITLRCRKDTGHNEGPCNILALCLHWHHSDERPKPPVTREVIIERHTKEQIYQPRLYLRYASFNPYQRIEHPFRLRVAEYLDEWDNEKGTSLTATEDLDRWEDFGRLCLRPKNSDVLEFLIECETSRQSEPDVQMQTVLPTRAVTKLRLTWDGGFPAKVLIGPAPAKEKNCPKESSSAGPFYRESDIYRLNKDFDIGAKAYRCRRDTVLLVFIAPRLGAKFWDMHEKTLLSYKSSGKALKGPSRMGLSDLPRWASELPSVNYQSLESSVPPVAHIEDLADAHDLRLLQHELWTAKRYSLHESEGREEPDNSTIAASRLRCAWTRTKSVMKKAQCVQPRRGSELMPDDKRVPAHNFPDHGSSNEDINKDGVVERR